MSPVKGILVILQIKKEMRYSDLKFKATNNFSKWWSIAASFLVLLGVGVYGYLNSDNSNKKQNLGSFDNPEVAFIETQKALLMLSININTAYDGMQYIKEYENSKNLIFKQY